MRLTLLLADSRDIYRAGLKNIFSVDPNVSHIGEVTTSKDLYTQMLTTSVDLIIANQALITDISHIAGSNVVIMTKRQDMHFCCEAILYGARAYLPEDASPALLRSTLYMVKGSFLLETLSMVRLIREGMVEKNAMHVDSEVGAVDSLHGVKQTQTGTDPIIHMDEARQKKFPTHLQINKKSHKSRSSGSSTNDPGS